MDREQAIRVIAQAVHETIRAYQGALGQTRAPAWDEAGEMQKWSIDAVELALAAPTPGAQHDAWVASKLRDGWRWGPSKDVAQKTHPSLVPFDELPQDEKNKDTILIAIVQTLSTVLAVSPG